MSNFEFPKSIMSRPRYAKLEARLGHKHLCICDGEGAEAIIDLVKANPDMAGKTQVIFIPKTTRPDMLETLQSLPLTLHQAPSFGAAQSRIAYEFANAHMGLQVYLAGTEGLIGQSMREAAIAGIPHSAIQTEHRGSVARRMQCVHCKGITEDVMHDPFQCAHCGLHLFVRDHYSKRLAAFQGVCIDAEDPGNIPISKALYT